MVESYQPVSELSRKLYWVYALFFTLSYIFSGFFCVFQLSVPPENYSLLWIPSGLGVIMFFILGYSAILWVLLASFILNTFSYLQHHFPNLDAYRLFLGFLNASIDALQAFIAWKIAIKLERKLKDPLFTRNSQLIPFFIFVCLLPSILTSGILILVKTFERPEGIDYATFLKLSIYLTVGNTIGILLIAPLYWARKLQQENGTIFKQFPLSITFAITGILLLSFYQFPSIVFLIIPLLVILARKGNFLHSIIVSFIICILLSVGTAHNIGFFGTYLDTDTSFETVLFLLSIIFVLYTATIAFFELNLHQNKLQLLVTQSVNSMEISEERYRMLAENVADVIWVWNLSENKFTYISPSVFQLRGLTVEEAMKETIDSSLEPNSAKEVMGKITRILASLNNHPDQKQYYYDEVLQYKKDGTLNWIETVSHLVINAKGQMEIFGVSRNINERKKAERILKENENQLKELNATKDKFFSIIAHDLMNPFHTLIGFSGLLISQTAKKDLDGVVVSAKLMKDSAEKTKNLLKNLLEWSYTQTGKISFDPEEIILQTIVQEALELLQVTADQKGIELNIEVPSDNVIFADKHMLSAILRNLISNAIKYTYSGGRIQLSAEKTATEWIFKIKDNGVGMLPEVYESIFEIGTHRSELGTEKEQGTGLGLILCKEFVERHRGKIGVESNIREGSSFQFTIPV
jgi:two-component system sensor histidine kinase/response regulator